MTIEKEEFQTCDACGVSAEMNFVIKDNDNIADVYIFAQGKEALESELVNYLALAKEINTGYKVETTSVTTDSTELTARIEFECTAEKLIFELRSRALAK